MDALPQRPQEVSAAAGGQGAPQRKETCFFFQAAPLPRHVRDRHGHHEAVPDWQLHRHSIADVNTAFSFGASAWSPC